MARIRVAHHYAVLLAVALTTVLAPGSAPLRLVAAIPHYADETGKEDRLFLIGHGFPVDVNLQVAVGEYALRVLRTERDLIVALLPRSIAPGTYPVRVGLDGTWFEPSIDVSLRPREGLEDPAGPGRPILPGETENPEAPGDIDGGDEQFAQEPTILQPARQ